MLGCDSCDLHWKIVYIMLMMYTISVGHRYHKPMSLALIPTIVIFAYALYLITLFSYFHSLSTYSFMIHYWKLLSVEKQRSLLERLRSSIGEYYAGFGDQ